MTSDQSEEELNARANEKARKAHYEKRRKTEKQIQKIFGL